MSAPEFRLDRWTGREYVQHGLSLGPPDELADCARMLGLPAWRVVRADKDRPARVPRWRPGKPGSGRSIADVRGEYLAWAKARGLASVAYYTGVPMHPALNGLAVRLIDPAEFLGPAPAAEIITEGEE